MDEAQQDQNSWWCFRLLDATEAELSAVALHVCVQCTYSLEVSIMVNVVQ